MASDLSWVRFFARLKPSCCRCNLQWFWWTRSNEKVGQSPLKNVERRLLPLPFLHLCYVNSPSMACKMYTYFKQTVMSSTLLPISFRRTCFPWTLKYKQCTYFHPNGCSETPRKSPEHANNDIGHVGLYPSPFLLLVLYHNNETWHTCIASLGTFLRNLWLHGLPGQLPLSLWYTRPLARQYVFHLPSTCMAL